MTPQMQAALSFIRQHLAEHDGVAPNYEEIRVAIGIGSRSGVNRILGSLRARGFISFQANRARSIRLTDGPTIEAMERWSDDELARVARDALTVHMMRAGRKLSAAMSAAIAEIGAAA